MATTEIAHAAAERLTKTLVGDDWTVGQGGTTRLIDPSTGSDIVDVPSLTIADLEHAIVVARLAFDDRRWRGKDADERARILWRIAELIEANIDELIALETLNGGAIRPIAQGSVASAAECFRYYAGACTRNHGISTDLSRSRTHHYTQQEPVGVAALIVPWNAPLLMAAWKVAPALAAGCSILLKPADETPLTAIRLGEILLEAGVPTGVVSIITGVGAKLGAHMGRHAGIDKISFTGSTAVGRSLIESSAGNLKRLTLELGGKSPFVICSDADLSRAIPTAAMSIFTHGGQICTSGSRILVARELHDQVVAGVAEIAKSMTIGSPFDPTTQLGPLVSERHLIRVSDMVASGISQGARLVIGGKRHGDVGSYIQPTVFADVKPEMRIVSEEIFGPVVAITPFDTLEEAARIANDHVYGLAAYIWSEDIKTTHFLAANIRAGTIWINTALLLDYAAPFGGFKQSGWGREHGPHGVEPYLETKSVFTAI